VRFPAEEINFLYITNQCAWLLFGPGTAHARMNSYTRSFDAKSRMTFFLSLLSTLDVSEKKISDLVLLSLEMALDQQLTLAKFSCKNTPQQQCNM